MCQELARTDPTHRTEPLVVARRASAGVPKEFFCLYNLTEGTAKGGKPV